MESLLLLHMLSCTGFKPSSTEATAKQLDAKLVNQFIPQTCQRDFQGLKVSLAVA